MGEWGTTFAEIRQGQLSLGPMIYRKEFGLFSKPNEKLLYYSDFRVFGKSQRWKQREKLENEHVGCNRT